MISDKNLSQIYFIFAGDLGISAYDNLIARLQSGNDFELLRILSAYINIHPLRLLAIIRYPEYPISVGRLEEIAIRNHQGLLRLAQFQQHPITLAQSDIGAEGALADAKPEAGVLPLKVNSQTN